MVMRWETCVWAEHWVSHAPIDAHGAIATLEVYPPIPVSGLPTDVEGMSVFEVTHQWELRGVGRTKSLEPNQLLHVRTTPW